MKKNLTARSVIILVTVLLCVYGIIGLPTSKAALMENFGRNIRLGLDRKGGSHLVLQEGIREVLRVGKGLIAGEDAGFSKAWWTIVDTHVTTVVSCCFLFLFGEGPVKGFAVTLVIGLIANVFTAVFVSKTTFDYELSGARRVETLSI